MVDDFSILQEDTLRIPVSLKFEKDEMYFNFIKPAREDKSLTKTILNLLRAYYEDDEIRKLVDARNAGEDILKALNEEIDRIALEHAKSIAQTNALKFDTEVMTGASFMDTSDVINITPVNAQNNSGNAIAALPSTPTMDNILAILNQLSSQVNNINSRMDEAGIPNISNNQSSINNNKTESIMPDFDKALVSGVFDDDDLYKATEEVVVSSKPKKPKAVVEEEEEEIYANTEVETPQKPKTKVTSQSVVDEDDEEESMFDIDDKVDNKVESKENVRIQEQEVKQVQETEQEVKQEQEVKKAVLPASFMKLSASLIKTSKGM